MQDYLLKNYQKEGEKKIKCRARQVVIKNISDEMFQCFWNIR